jgi:uncharacterized protein YegL
MPAKKTAPKNTAKKASPKSPLANEILINFVLDKSGSMATCLDDTVGGFNTYISELKNDKKSAYSFSLTLFDTRFENRHVAINLSGVPDLTKQNYLPGGGTALLDAIGRTVSAVEAKGEKYDKVLTVILTDGQENASREFNLAKIKELIEKKEGEGNWTFVFLGADLSAFTAGDSMGINLSNSVKFNQQNVRAAYANTAHATMAFSASIAGRTNDFYKSVPERKMAAAGMSRRMAPVGKGGPTR